MAWLIVSLWSSLPIILNNMKKKKKELRIHYSATTAKTLLEFYILEPILTIIYQMNPWAPQNFIPNSLPFHHLKREMQNFHSTAPKKGEKIMSKWKMWENWEMKKTQYNERHTCSTALSWRSIDKDSSLILSFWQTASMHKREYLRNKFLSPQT